MTRILLMTTVMLTLNSGIGGCGGAQPRRVRVLAIIDTSLTALADDVEFAYPYLENVLRAESVNPSQYRREDFQLVSVHDLPRQASLPAGGKIFKAIAVQSGIAEVERTDWTVSIFRIPGKTPVYLSDGIPSKCGWEEQYHVYDLGYSDRLLIICQGEQSACGGSISLLFWNIRNGQIQHIWSCCGEEDGSRFAHEMSLGPTGSTLTIHGIFAIKRAAYEPDRKKLSKVLGLSVRFIYDYR